MPVAHSPEPPAYYLINEVLPAEKMHIIAGASGAGKTTLTFQLVRDILDGKPWLGHAVRSGLRVGYVGTDRDTTAYAHKFECTGIPPFPVYSLLDSAAYRPSDVKNFSEKWLSIVYEMGGQPDLLVIDPISCFLPAKISDYHGNADTLITMNRFCRKNRVTILGTYHAGKLKADQGFMRPQDRILGTGALLAFSDTQIFLTDAEEVPRQPGYHILTINPHDRPREVHKLRRDDNGLFVPWVEADEFVREQKLLKLVPFEPDMRATSAIAVEASDALDCSEKTVRRMLDKLADDGFLFKPKYGYFSRRKTS